MELTLEPGLVAMCRLDPDEDVPSWVEQPAPLRCGVRTADELSLVAAYDAVPNGVRAEGPFSVLKVAGPIDFASIGVLAALAAPLAESDISILAVSTFDTDYVLVREQDTAQAVEALRAAGHPVRNHAS